MSMSGISAANVTTAPETAGTWGTTQQQVPQQQRVLDAVVGQLLARAQPEQRPPRERLLQVAATREEKKKKRTSSKRKEKAWRA